VGVCRVVLSDHRRTSDQRAERRDERSVKVGPEVVATLKENIWNEFDRNNLCSNFYRGTESICDNSWTKFRVTNSYANSLM
jgi:hypothetical protein